MGSHWSHPSVVRSGGHHWRPVQSCSLEEAPVTNTDIRRPKHIQLASGQSASDPAARWGGGGQETWNLCGRIWWPSFLWLICTGLGGHGPLGTPPGSATGQYTSYCNAFLFQIVYYTDWISHCPLVMVARLKTRPKLPTILWKPIHTKRQPKSSMFVIFSLIFFAFASHWYKWILIRKQMNI